MTSILSVGEADDELAPYRDRIAQAIKKAWERWRELLAHDLDLGAVISARSRATLMYDFIRHEALAAFEGDPNVVVSEDRGFLLLTFNQKIILRYKKFRGRTLKTSGASTKQAKEYANQVLPGMVELTHLVAGYLPDEVGMTLERAAITCTLGEDLLWVIELDLGLGGGDAGDLAPIKPVKPSTPSTGTIVRPRREQGADQQTSEER